MKVVLQDLTKKFKSRDKKGKGEVVAVDHFTFEIPDGELVGLLGPSRLWQEHHPFYDLRAAEAYRRKDLFWRR